MHFVRRALKDHNPSSERYTARSFCCRDILSGASHGIPTLQGVLGPSACAFCMTLAPAKATIQKGTFPFSAPHAQAAGVLLPGCRLGISGLISCGFCFVVPLRKTRCPWHFGEVRGVGNQDRNGMTWTGLDSQASINTIVLQPSQDVRSVTTP